MKKLLVIVLVAAASATIFGSCGGGSVKFNTESDSLSYAMGSDLGRYLKNMDSTLAANGTTLKMDVVFTAIKESMADKSRIAQDSIMPIIQNYFMVTIPERAKKAGEEFLAKIEKENKNVQKTESGLMYEIIEPGDPAVMATQDADKVKVVYEGTLRTGKVFDSSIERGDTAEFALNRVIKGWGEGMKLVGKGGKIKLYVPSDLGYGARGTMNGSIGANEPLVFDVTLIDVIPAPEEEKK